MRIVPGQWVANSHEGWVMSLWHVVLRRHHHPWSSTLGRRRWRTHSAWLRLVSTRERLMAHTQAWWGIERWLSLLSRHESHEIFTRLLLLLLHGCGMHRCLLLLVLKQEMRSANATHGLTQRENWVGALNLGVVMSSCAEGTVF